MRRRPSLRALGVSLLFLTFSADLIRAQEPGPSPPSTPGVPWTGDLGVTATVQEIMSRPAEPVSGTLREAKDKRKSYPSRRGLPQNPSSPATPSYPAPDGGQTTHRETVPYDPQTVGTSFLATQLSESGFIPPDTVGDVSPSQVLVCSNGRIKVFNRAGVLGSLNTTSDTFFASVLSAGQSTTDPRVRFDRLSGRWFVTMISVTGLAVEPPNKVLIAVSNSSTITDVTSFTFFSFQNDLVGPTPNPDTNNFADYDTLGVDANALYIGVNMFNGAGTMFLSTTGFVVRKSSVLSGGPIVVTAFRQLATSTGVGPYTPQGVEDDDPVATEGYFIGVDTVFFGRLVVRRVSTPGGTPSISGNLNISVPATQLPIDTPALGSVKPLDALDDRLFAAMMKNGRLWTAHNIEVNSSGVATVGGGRNGSRWYEVGSLTTTPTLIQSGTLFDSATVTPRSFWIPSAAVSGQGHMALGSSVAGAAEHAEIAAAGRLAADTLGTIRASLVAQASSTTYNVQVVPARQRWGDYSVTRVDPTDDMTMWTFQEYCNAADSWGVRVIKLVAPPPATPVGAAPSIVAAGQASVNVTISGTSSSGSGFFDPGPDTGGPGFPNRIAASVTGGVAVNSVTFTNPTQVTLNISTVGTPVGAKTVTVTNPDGQSVTSASGILTVTAAAPAPTVTNINPNSGTTAGGTPVTITGTNFQSGATVTIGGVAATGVVFVNSTTLNAVTGPHAAGVVSVVVTNPDSQSGTLVNGYTYAGNSFFTVTPCRVLDTRNPAGPYGGPPLAANTDRTFVLAGQCGIPVAAKAVSINMTITQPTDLGDLRLYPGGTPLPLVSSINYRGGQTRANNAIVSLGAAGDLAVRCVQLSGTVHFIIDVNGYFR